MTIWVDSIKFFLMKSRKVLWKFNYNHSFILCSKQHFIVLDICSSKSFFFFFFFFFFLKFLCPIYELINLFGVPFQPRILTETLFNSHTKLLSKKFYLIIIIIIIQKKSFQTKFELIVRREKHTQLIQIFTLIELLKHFIFVTYSYCDRNFKFNSNSINFNSNSLIMF